MKRFLHKIKNHFVPHFGNNHEPHFFRNKSIFFFLSLIIFIELSFLVQVFVVFDKTNFLASVLPGVLTAITNEDRSLNGASNLVANNLLQKAAQLKANDMATRGYFSHNSPEGITPWYWLEKVGYKYKYAGENLAIDFSESKDVAEAWMNSPTHRANIVNKKYTEIGIAVADGFYEGKKTVFVVQYFGTPKALSIPSEKQIPTTVTISNENLKTEQDTEISTTQSRPEDVRVLGEESSPSVLEESQPIYESPNAEVLLGKVLTSPRTYVNYVYQGIALLFALSLFIFLVKTEKKHPSVILKGTGMLAFIVVLIVLNLNVYKNQTLLPSDTEIVETSIIS